MTHVLDLLDLLFPDHTCVTPNPVMKLHISGSKWTNPL